jgi:hypothetical protein
VVENNDVPIDDHLIFCILSRESKRLARLSATDFVPATVSIHMKWTARGDVHEHEPGASGPTDPAHFDFRLAVATGTFSGSELGFSFTGSASSEGVFAEMGHERNGLFLQSK